MCTFLLRQMNKSWSRQQDFFKKYFRICEISFRLILRIRVKFALPVLVIQYWRLEINPKYLPQFCTSTIHRESVFRIRNVLVRIQIRIPPRLMASQTERCARLPPTAASLLHSLRWMSASVPLWLRMKSTLVTSSALSKSDRVISNYRYCSMLLVPYLAATILPYLASTILPYLAAKILKCRNKLFP